MSRPSERASHPSPGDGAALTARHHFDFVGRTLRSWLCQVAGEPARRWLPGPVSSSSHSREGFGVPGPDLFSCFRVSGGDIPTRPLLWRDNHVYTCLSLPPRPKGLLSGWGPGPGGAKSPSVDLILAVLELTNIPTLQMRKLSSKGRKGRIVLQSVL